MLNNIELSSLLTNNLILNIYTFNIINDLSFILPESFIFFSLLILIFYGSFYSNINIYKYVKLSKPISNLVILIIFFYIVLLLNNVSFNYIISSYLLYNDKLILFLKVFISILSIIIIKISFNYLLLKDINIFEFYIFFLISLISLNLIIMSYDFIIAYLSIELQGLCSYILVALNRSSNKSIESSLKYFVLGSFASSILLLGISFIYWSTGMTNFKDISDLLQLGLDETFFNNIFLLGITFITIGIFFKISIAPFHIWLPDIFYGSNKVIVLVFSLLPKISLLALFIKVYSLILIKINLDWEFYSLFFIFLSLIIGINGALKVKKINKLIAYSSISHIGFILIPLVTLNLEVFLIYIFLYSFLLISIFVNFFLLINNNKNSLNNINELVYIKKSNYIVFLSLIISFFSISGIPPLSGFFGKFLIFINLINLNLYFITLILLLLSVLSCFYYLRIIKIVSFNNSKNWFFIKNFDKSVSLFLSFSILFNIFIFLFIPFFFELFHFIILF